MTRSKRERYEPYQGDKEPLFTIDVMTLFPDMIDTAMQTSVIGRAAAKGIIRVRATDIRDYGMGKNRRTDDYPYGGGKGLVMMAEPLFRCHEAITGGEHVHTVLMSAQGRPFTQEVARELLAKGRFVIVCGHYEGVDQRFIDECVDEEICLGSFVLTGGEIPAMAVADCVCRMVPGVLSEEVCFTEESHWNGLLEYPQYTRPEEWRGRRVPQVLLSGNHRDVHRWQRVQAMMRTLLRRPKLMESAKMSPEEQAIYVEVQRDLMKGKEQIAGTDIVK